MKKMSPLLINFSTVMSILSLPSIIIVPLTLVYLLEISNQHIQLLVAVLYATLIIVLFFYFEDKATDLGYREEVALNYAKKNKRAESVINPDTYKSVMSVIEKNHKLRVYFVDFKFFITEFIKNSDKVYDADKIRELDNQVRESYETVSNLLLSDGVKSVLNGYAKDFKKDVINVAAALIKKHRDIVYDLALEAQDSLNESNATNEKDKNNKAERDAVDIIQNPEYKKLVQEG
jgi:hypothetical protein